jgi:hypothetical protein
MELISQQLEVKDWPLVEVGQEKFFGYVVAMGVFPNDWDETMTHYVDFAYNDAYERYRLPQHEGLRKQLFQYLWDNLHPGDIYGKVVIKRFKDGYCVGLP